MNAETKLKPITARELKCLRRIADRKSVHDMKAWSDLQDNGFLEIKDISTHPSEFEAGEFEHVITPAGRTALLKAGG